MFRLPGTSRIRMIGDPAISIAHTTLFAHNKSLRSSLPSRDAESVRMIASLCEHLVFPYQPIDTLLAFQGVRLLSVKFHLHKTVDRGWTVVLLEYRAVKHEANQKLGIKRNRFRSSGRDRGRDVPRSSGVVAQRSSVDSLSESRAAWYSSYLPRILLYIPRRIKTQARRGYPSATFRQGNSRNSSIVLGESVIDVAQYNLKQP